MRKLSIAALICVWLGLLLGLLGRWAWPFDLFSNFRLQYFALFLLVALGLLFSSRKAYALAAFAGAVVAAIPLAGYVGLPGAPAEARPATLRLVTFNTWHRNRDLARIAKYLEGTQADVIVLQELTNARAQQLHVLLPAYPHFVLKSSDLGAVIFSKWPVVQSRPVPLSNSANGSFATIDWQGRRINLLGLHLHWPLGPWSARLRNEELNSIAKFAAGFDQPLLVAGDMNLTPWSPHFTHLLREAELTDAALGHGLSPSWPSQFRPMGIRIDQCLTSEHWRSVSLSVGPHVGSDHRPLIVELQLL